MYQCLSNKLLKLSIIQQVKTNGIMTVIEVWIPNRNWYTGRFWFYFSLFQFLLWLRRKTLETVFHRLSKHLKFRQKYPAAHQIFNSLSLVFGYPNETLSLVFDIITLHIPVNWKISQSYFWSVQKNFKVINCHLYKV